jgi:hypothetical protein
VAEVREEGWSLREVVARGRLTWWPQIGVGYYPVENGPETYDEAYFDNYATLAQTPMGRAIMRARFDFVDRHFKGTLIDVGIGCGAFVNLRRGRHRTTYGWDVCPKAMAWLEERGLALDPHLVPVRAITLWDVLEHIHDFRSLLANVRDWVFVSIPIFQDHAHVLHSKHFKPREHVWYFTADGLIDVMKSLDFECVEHNDMESRIGREDIGTFAFRRT